MTNVADLKIPGKDAIGQPITCLYGRKPPEFAVYRVGRRVMVHFADDDATAAKQRKDLALLAPLRGEVDGLIDGWREGTSRRFFGVDNSAKLNSKAVRYDRRVGDALVVAMEGDVATAQLLLTQVREDIVNERVAWARFEYLISAFLAALGVMFTAWLISAIYPLVGDTDADTRIRMVIVGLVLVVLAALAGAALVAAGHKPKAAATESTAPDGETPEQAKQREEAENQARAEERRQDDAAKMQIGRLVSGALLFAIVAIPAITILILPLSEYTPVDPAYQTPIDMWRAAAAGAVGAFFSISLAIRGRTILPDLLRTSNLMDAVLRITIGFIAGAVVLALIREGVVNFQFGDRDAGEEGTLAVVVIGFIAGFSERLVPDLLEKASFSVNDPSAAAATARAQAQVQARIPMDQAADAEAKKAAAGAAAEADAKEEEDPLPEEATDDACVADVDLEDDEVAPDSSLPPASGGVAAPKEGEKP